MNEKSLLKKLQNKDEKALEDIIDLYNAYVTTIVGSLLSSKGTKEDMEEVVADTFIALWCKLRSNGMPVPLLRNGYSIFNGTKYR